MPHIRADSIKNYTATTGTGSYTIGSAVTGFRSLTAVMSNGDTAVFGIKGADSAGSEAKETIVGTYNSGTGTIARTTLLESTTGSAINWGAGNKEIYITDAAKRSVALSADGASMVGLSANLTLTGVTGVLTLPGSLDIQGVATLAAGSVSAPALARAGDTNTGLYFPGADQVALVTAGVSRLSIGASGDIAIGANAGGNRLIGFTYTSAHVAGNASVLGLHISDGGGASGLFVHNVHNGTFSSQYLSMKTAQGGSTAATERMRIAADGLISLGAAPGAESLSVSVVASAVMGLRAAGAVTGGVATLSVVGTDANSDLGLSPKGTGLLRWGTHASLGSEVLSGYITIKDSGGTTRKLAVIS